MSIPPESLRKLFKLGHRGTVSLKDAKQPTDQRTSRNDLAFSPRNPFPEQKHTLLLISEQSDRGGALWRAKAARLTPAGDHCYPSSGGLSAEPGRSGSPRPVKEQYNRNFPRASAVVLRGGGDSGIRHGQGAGAKG